MVFSASAQSQAIECRAVEFVVCPDRSHMPRRLGRRVALVLDDIGGRAQGAGHGLRVFDVGKGVAAEYFQVVSQLYVRFQFQALGTDGTDSAVEDFLRQFGRQVSWSMRNSDAVNKLSVPGS